MAPHPNDILWYNITNRFKFRRFQRGIYGFLLLLLFIFFTTPTAILNTAQSKISILRYLLSFDYLAALGPETVPFLQNYTSLLLTAVINIIALEMLDRLAYL